MLIRFSTAVAAALVLAAAVTTSARPSISSAPRAADPAPNSAARGLSWHRHLTASGQDSGDGEEVAAPAAAKPSVLDFAVPPAHPAGRPRWVGSWEEAIQEATLRNCPVVVMHSDDQSEGYKTVARLAYAEPGFAAFTAQCVMLTSFGGEEHAHEEREVGGEEVRWCGIFDCPCAAHQQSHARVTALFVKGAFRNPLHLFLEPGGFELSRLQGHLVRLTDLQDQLKAARRKIDGVGISYTRYREHLGTLRELVDQRHKKGWGRSIKQLREFAKKDSTITLGLRQLTEKLERALLGEGRDQLAEARALLEAGDKGAAKKLVSKILRDFRDTDVAEEARELRKEF